MRILLTSLTQKTGVMTHMWDLAKQLQSGGVEVRVAILEIPNGSWKTDPIQLEPFKKAGIPCLMYRTSDELAQLALREQVDLIHAHSSLAYPSSEAASKRLSLPLVITLHGVHPFPKRYPSTLAHAKQIIAVGPAQAKSGGPAVAKKITVIENGIDVNRFHPVTSWTDLDPTAPLQVMWFGRSRSSMQSGIETVNEAVKRLRAQGMQIDLKMVGNDPTAPTDQFTILGWMTDPVPLLQGTHVTFGHGRSLREAMACGSVGIVAGAGYGGIVKENWFTRKDPLPVAALPEYNLPDLKVEEVMRVLTELSTNRDLLAQYRKMSRLIAERYFDVKQMTKRTIDVYQQAIGP